MTVNTAAKAVALLALLLASACGGGADPNGGSPMEAVASSLSSVRLKGMSGAKGIVQIIPRDKDPRVSPAVVSHAASTGLALLAPPLPVGSYRVWAWDEGVKKVIYRPRVRVPEDLDESGELELPLLPRGRFKVVPAEPEGINIEGVRFLDPLVRVADNLLPDGSVLVLGVPQGSWDYVVSYRGREGVLRTRLITAKQGDTIELDIR